MIKEKINKIQLNLQWVIDISHLTTSQQHLARVDVMMFLLLLLFTFKVQRVLRVNAGSRRKQRRGEIKNERTTRYFVFMQLLFISIHYEEKYRLGF